MGKFVKGEWIESSEIPSESAYDVEKQVVISNECRGDNIGLMPCVTKGGRCVTVYCESTGTIYGVRPRDTEFVEPCISYLAYNWDTGVYELVDAPTEPSLFWQIASTVVGLVLIAVIVYNMVTIV